MSDEIQDDLIKSQIPKPQPAAPATMAPGIGIKEPWTGEWYQPPIESRDTKPLLSEEPVRTSRDSTNAPGDRYRFTSKP